MITNSGSFWPNLYNFGCYLPTPFDGLISRPLRRKAAISLCLASSLLISGVINARCIFFLLIGINPFLNPEPIVFVVEAPSRTPDSPHNHYPRLQIAFCLFLEDLLTNFPHMLAIAPVGEARTGALKMPGPSEGYVIHRGWVP